MRIPANRRFPRPRQPDHPETRFMSANTIHHFRLDNGLTLLCEEMPWLESAAVSISLPAGCLFDPANQLGLSSFTSEMVQRGCGERSSREYLEALEWLGVDDSSSVSVYFSQYGASMPAAVLPEAMQIFSDLVRRPQLPADQLEDARQVCHQEIRSIEDDVSHKAMVELKDLVYGDPLGRNSAGNAQSIDSIQLQDIRDFFAAHYRPGGMLISVAGKIQSDKIYRTVSELFGDWAPQSVTNLPEGLGEAGVRQIEFDSQQTQIAMAYRSVPYGHDEYFLARAAVGALSGGMSSRLFSEVREKRGLCYTVSASLHTTLSHGTVIAHAGTSADRAQQTLDVMGEQFRLMRQGITEDELARVKVQIRSALVLQQESSRARAASNAGDWFHLGKCRSRDEVNSIVQNLSVSDINGYLERNPFGEYSLVTLGPQPLEVTHGISA